MNKFPGFTPVVKKKKSEWQEPVVSPERRAIYDKATKEYFAAFLALPVQSKERDELAANHDKWMKKNGFRVTRAGLVDLLKKD